MSDIIKMEPEGVEDSDALFEQEVDWIISQLVLLVEHTVSAEIKGILEDTCSELAELVEDVDQELEFDDELPDAA